MNINEYIERNKFNLELCIKSIMREKGIKQNLAIDVIRYWILTNDDLRFMALKNNVDLSEGEK